MRAHAREAGGPMAQRRLTDTEPKGTMQTMDSWQKRDAETKKAFGAFAFYLGIGSKRTLRQCSEAGEYSLSSVKKWSMNHDWDTRATAHDVEMLARAADGREQVRETVRQAMMDDTIAAQQTIQEIRNGRVSVPECGPECTEDRCMCGVWLPILDRHGEIVGRKPAIAAATRGTFALAELDRCGMAPPKRVEITGKDGERLRLDARLAMGKLSSDKLDAILGAFAPDDD